MLKVEKVTFDYPGRRALDNVSFTLEEGSVTALIGPNGAGKSTLMRVIAALDPPATGRVFLQDRDVHKRPREAHGLMGLLPDFFGLYDDLSVYRNLWYRARAQAVPSEKADAAVRRAAEKTKIGDRLKDKAGSLSRGLRQRLAIAQAIIHDPLFLILDEPASGLDPLARTDLSLLLKDLNRSGMTILVSSHILTELEDYSTHMLALEDGRLLLHEKLQDPAGEGREIILRISLAQPDANFATKLQSLPYLSTIRIEEDQGEIAMGSSREQQAALLRDLIESGFKVTEFTPLKQGLQDAYLARLKGKQT